MRLPSTAPTLSSATSLKLSWIDGFIAELRYLPVITENFADLSAWTETDADGKVNLSGGVITLDGSGAAWNTHGLYYTAGIARAAGYVQLDISIPSAAVTNWVQFGLNNSAAIINGSVADQVSFYGGNAGTIGTRAQTSVLGYSPIAADTFYTCRVYIGQSYDGATWKAVLFTIQGGAYVNETPVASSDFMATAIAATFYPSIGRYLTNAGNLTSVKEFRWYSGYATDNPYIETVYDAGDGKVFDNFDPTNLAMPGTVVSTNLKFAWSFDDGAAAYSSYLTLAALNAIGKQTARHRYIRIRVQNALTDGSTQVYLAQPNSDTATDGVGDFPEVANVWSGDTVQGSAGTEDQPALSSLMASDTLRGAEGTLALANVLVAAGGTFDEAARNTALAAKYQSGQHFNLLGVDTVGEYGGGSVPIPSAPTIAATVISSTRVDLTIATFGANAATHQPKYKLVAGAYQDFGGTINTHTVSITGLTANSAYVFKVTATNTAGSTDSNEVTVNTNASADCISALITNNLVTAVAAVTTANGYNTNVAYCEQERLTDRKNDRYPMVTVAGPYQNFDADEHTLGTRDMLNYTLFYEARLDDRDTDDDSISKQARNISADIIKGVMQDRRRGEYAINTRVQEAFYTVDFTNDDAPEFIVVVTLEVETILDATNHYQNG